MFSVLPTDAVGLAWSVLGPLSVNGLTARVQSG
jgi:hypothetical protein